MITFYSDTQTKPTPGMRAAIAAAEVGDEQRGEDPTTNALCARVADLLGKEAAVFLPSGSMCNEIAIRVHCAPGDEAICAEDAHIVHFETGGPAALSGVMLRGLPVKRGLFGADQVGAAIRAPNRYAPRSRLVCVEQTSNLGGGTVWPAAQLDAVAEVARDQGLATHMDGARLMNAVVASGRPAHEHARSWDSVWVDLSKGLGCPVGAVLVGSAEFVDAAWRLKQQWGGAMRQSGILAAAGLYALDHHVERLADDHARAKRIADALRGLSSVSWVSEVETNILFFDVAPGGPTLDRLHAALAARGIDAGQGEGRRMRLVTHLDVDDDAVDTLVAVLPETLG